MELNRMIDHTILKTDTSGEAVMQIIEEAEKYHSYSICTNPAWVALAKEQLQGGPVAVCTVIGFPLGANTPETKAFETTDAINNGADEVDMVINIDVLKSKDDQQVQEGIEAVVEAAKGRALVKVIIETSLLGREEIIRACEVAKATGTDFVKTSTGFSAGGVKVEDIRLMREAVGLEMDIKASGGIHNEEGAMAMVEAGATRIETSAGAAIISGPTGEGY